MNDVETSRQKQRDRLLRLAGGVEAAELAVSLMQDRLQAYVQGLVERDGWKKTEIAHDLGLSRRLVDQMVRGDY